MFQSGSWELPDPDADPVARVPEAGHAALQWDARGLLPAVVQDAHTGDVLMVAWMSREALRLTMETGETYFWSRSRGELWHKGETSGNTQSVKGIWIDCDGDTLLVKVEPAGPACHTGAVSCFFRPLAESFSAESFADVEGERP